MNESLVEALIDYCNAIEAAAVNLRRRIQVAEAPTHVEIPEEATFGVLKWSDEKGAKLGNYQVAYKNHNASESWQNAFNILKANNSLIDSRFHEPSYEYAYWIWPPKYEDRIFRKKINQSKN